MAAVPHIHEEDEEPGFLRKFGVWIAVAVVLVGVAGAWLAFRGESKPKPKVAQMRVVDLMPVAPPPPPPPPPPPQEPPPERLPEPEVQDQPDFQPEEAPTEAPPADEPEPADEPPLGTSIVGDGPGNGFGLAAGGGMGVIGGKGKGGGGSGGSKFGWYAGQVQSRVADALRKHPKTRSAQLVVTVRIWADSTGRVTRAAVSDSSGNPDLDRALQNEILTGLRLQSPPPEDMPMPIVMRISARRPN